MSKIPRGIKIEKLPEKTIIRYSWDRLIFFIHFLKALFASIIGVLFFGILFLLIGFLCDYLGVPSELAFSLVQYGTVGSVLLMFAILLYPSLPYLFNSTVLEITEDDLHLTHHQIYKGKEEHYLAIASIQELSWTEDKQRLEQQLLIKGRTEQLKLKGMYPDMKKIKFLHHLIEQHIKLEIEPIHELEEKQQIAIDKLEDFNK